MKTNFTFSSKLFTFFLVCFLSFNTTIAQTAPCAPCTSSDIKVLGGELVDQNGISLSAGTCNAGNSIDVYLKINLNVTSSQRYGFLITGKVILNGVAIDINRCISNTLSSGPHSFLLDKNSNIIGNGVGETPIASGVPFQWTCGSSIQLAQVFTAWSQNSPSTPGIYEVCGFYNTITGYNCSNLTPKCKFYGPWEQIIISTPLASNFEYSSSCQGDSYQKITFSSTTTGGSRQILKNTFLILTGSNYNILDS